ncbi:MAG TPA: DUF1015 domain-containing protein [Cyclobacteriaceae bacterium]|jgi:uncharacterized protein (DUF1015 family)|nr:DUF1015 domain-containing protein [Cyclobacteriaceae bacterium]
MADIKPLRAWRYNEDLSKNIDELTSPLFDVVSEKQRKALYQNPYNSIHLSVPATDHPADHAALLLATWKKEGIIKQDDKPGIYVYYQYYRLPGSSEEFCRKGFICNIRIHDWNEKIILRHENTIPKSVNDRIEILEKTKLNVSATYGLYTDTTYELEPFLDEAILQPIYETEDYQGVRDVLAVITDAKIIEKFISLLKIKTIILADGHHRYEGSLIHKQQQEKLNTNHTGEEGYNFHLMYLTNTEDGNMRILPTHRLLKNLNGLSEKTLMEKFEKNFIVKKIEEASTLNEIIIGKKWAFGIVLPQGAYKVRLKPEAFPKLRWPFPLEVKSLDLTVMHYFIIEKILGIPGKEQRQSDNILFERNFIDCLEKVHMGEAQLAIITNEVTIEEVKSVCASGYTMPQKSTYFYPKVICGLLFSSIED